MRHPSSPAWHRRARRVRAGARLTLKQPRSSVSSSSWHFATSLLRRHHGSTVPMPKQTNRPREASRPGYWQCYDCNNWNQRGHRTCPHHGRSVRQGLRSLVCRRRRHTPRAAVAHRLHRHSRHVGEQAGSGGGHRRQVPSQCQLQGDCDPAVDAGRSLLRPTGRILPRDGGPLAQGGREPSHACLHGLERAGEGRGRQVTRLTHTTDVDLEPEGEPLLPERHEL